MIRRYLWSCLVGWCLVTRLAAEDTPIRVALFEDQGVAGKGIPCVTEQLGKYPQMQVVRVSGQQVATTGLRDFDVVIFTGGSASKQSAALGEPGRAEVRRFVDAGGGYLGICAGAYLALSGSEKWLGLVDGKTKSPKWQRGVGDVWVEVTPLGAKIVDRPASDRSVRYANGPIFAPAHRDDVPDFEPLALFRSELAKNGSPPGIMVDSPAIVRGRYGRGRVVISSPHPEQTAGWEPTVLQIVQWIAGRTGE